MATYTGTGTQDDPYIVADWDSFTELLKLTNVYIKWAEVDNKVIDFNEINPDGFTSTINVQSYVDFNDWTFRNMRFITKNAFSIGKTTSDATMYNQYIKNLNIENIMITGSGIIYLGDSNKYARNVSVTGSIVGENPTNWVDIVFSNYSFGNIYACSFVIDTPNPVRCLAHTSARDTYMKINSRGDYGSSNITYGTAGTANMSVINCLFKIIAPKIPILNILAVSGSGSQKTKISSCVFIIDTPVLKSNKSNLTINASIFNSDLAKDYTDVSNVSGLFPCTTEQMKDVEYLQSIGFPIGAV